MAGRGEAGAVGIYESKLREPERDPNVGDLKKDGVIMPI